MNRKLVGVIAVTSVVVLALGGVAVALSAQAAERQGENTATVGEISAPTAPPSTSAEAAAEPATVIDPMSAEYDPYSTPGDRDYVSPDMKAKWYAKEAVLRKCMTDKGLVYETAPFWLTTSGAQPKGLSYNESIEWLIGFAGENYMQPTGVPEESGCSGLGQLIDNGTLVAPPVPVPADPLEKGPTERQIMLAHHELVRGCMAERGFEYLYFENWNPKYMWTVEADGTRTPVAKPSQPDGMSEEQQAAWSLALWGDTGGGADYRWQDAGCAGYATHASGNDSMY